MLTKDIYGKTLSQDFQTATNSYAQKIKPKVLITFLDSRHIDNLTISTNDPYASNTKGTYASQMSGSAMTSGYFFEPKYSMSGVARETFPWAICNAKDKYGKTIKADGNWYTMPNSHDDNYKFGWISPTASTTTAHANSGYSFTTAPYVEYTFTERKVNKIRIVTSEFSGKISYYRVQASNANLSIFYDQYGSFEPDEYFKDHIIPSSVSNDVSTIRVTVYSTINKQDYARIIEVVPLYEVDITDYVISHSVDRQGELWENSIPIAGSASSSASIVLDNTTRAFNPFYESSLYGKYMKKDLKINIYTGWRVVKTDSLTVSSPLTVSMSNVASTMTVSDASGFLNGNNSNLFTLLIDAGTVNEEIVLCSSRTDKTVTIEERGYANTPAKAHNVGAVVSFDPYEYVNNGEFYIDEWTGGSSMDVTIKCLDKTKFLTEKQFTKGFYVQNSIVGNAIKNILMQSNISQNEFYQLVPYSQYAKENAIAHYSFSEPIVDRTGQSALTDKGLRLRVWKMPLNKRNEVKDIKADVLDIQLSDYDKALKVKPYYPQTFTQFSPGANAANLTDFSFSDTSTDPATTVSEYYNAVFDGYYIPSASATQSFVITIRNGGVRMYLNDNLIINQWNRPQDQTSTRTIESSEFEVDSGIPYKIRIEIYHAEGAVGQTSSLNFLLSRKPSGGSATPILTTECRTIIAEDSLGSRNSSWGTVTSSSPYTISTSLKNRNLYRNNGLYVGSPTLAQSGGLVSEPDNKCVSLTTTSSINIPYDESINLVNLSSTNYTGEFTIELYAKFPNGAFTGDGAYVSNETTVSSINYGYTFYYNSSGHGFTLHTPSGNEICSSNAGIDSDKWQHICITFKNGTLKYYQNGQHRDTTSSVSLTTFGLGDISIGNTTKNFLIDEFTIYNKCLDGDTIKNRYITTQIKPITSFPHLYGNDKSAKNIIDDIALGDFGRFYVDESDMFVYHHYYRFFESVLEQHSTSQKTISSNSHIVSGEYTVQIQANKVTVKVTSQTPALSQRQKIWGPAENESLGVVKLTQNITSTSTTIPVSTTNKPPFPASGYIKIDNEIIKYASIDDNNFIIASVSDRAQFDTQAEAHYTNTPVCEVRKYDITYETVPAFNVYKPFITAISNTAPPEIFMDKFIHNAYNAELVLSATTAVPAGNIAYIQGTNPETLVQQATSIAGIAVKKQESSDKVTSQSATLSEDIKKYGLKEIVIENEYIYGAEKAKEIADFIIDKFKTPIPVLNITTLAIPTLQIGDRITISTLDSLQIENISYWVVSHSLNVGDTLDHSIVLRKVI